MVGGHGAGGGDYLALLPVTPPLRVGEGETAMLLNTLAETPGVSSAHYAACNDTIAAASSAKDDRAGDRYADGLILAHAQTLADAQAAAAMLTAARLAGAGLAAQWIASACVLRLIYHLAAPASHYGITISI